MANEKNLKGFTSNQSREEAVKNGQKGGIRSGEVRRERKAMREQMEMLLKLPPINAQAKQKIKELGIDEKEIDNQMLLMVAIFNKAMKGDIQAVNVVRELTGERIQQTEVQIKQPTFIDDLEDD